MAKARFDHIAVAVPRLADLVGVLEGTLGGRRDYGAPSGAYAFYQWSFAGGGHLELLEPLGADGFLHRFLAARGPGVHHVTFKVPSLAEACERARGLGYAIVGYDDANPRWQEAFLHPREAQGIVVQLAATSGEGGAPRGFAPPPGPPDPPPPITLVGLRLSARSAARARAQWAGVVQGEESPAPDGALVFRWPGSPMRLRVAIDPARAEGPLGLEYTADREVALPPGPHPLLGVPLVRLEAGEA